MRLVISRPKTRTELITPLKNTPGLLNLKNKETARQACTYYMWDISYLPPF